MSGLALKPCATTLHATVMETTLTNVSAWCPSSSKANSAKMTEAKPRGPNHPIKADVATPRRVRYREMNTGTILTTVRLTAAYARQRSRSGSERLGRSIAAPKANQTRHARSWPAPSVRSSASGETWCRKIPKHNPARKAPTNPFPWTAMARAYVPIAAAGVAIAAVPGSVQAAPNSQGEQPSGGEADPDSDKRTDPNFAQRMEE